MITTSHMLILFTVFGYEGLLNNISLSISVALHLDSSPLKHKNYDKIVPAQ